MHSLSPGWIRWWPRPPKNRPQQPSDLGRHPGPRPRQPSPLARARPPWPRPLQRAEGRWSARSLLPHLRYACDDLQARRLPPHLTPKLYLCARIHAQLQFHSPLRPDHHEKDLRFVLYLAYAGACGAHGEAYVRAQVANAGRRYHLSRHHRLHRQSRPPPQTICDLRKDLLLSFGRARRPPLEHQAVGRRTSGRLRRRDQRQWHGGGSGRRLTCVRRGLRGAGTGRAFILRRSRGRCLPDCCDSEPGAPPCGWVNYLAHAGAHVVIERRGSAGHSKCKFCKFCGFLGIQFILPSFFSSAIHNIPALCAETVQTGVPPPNAHEVQVYSSVGPF
jgi:hypothetical protein